MDFYTALQAELKTYPEREQKLRGITRYHNLKIMFYRTHLFTHSKRVALLTQHWASVAQKYFPDFDVEKAVAIALVHDDAEIITGDFQAGDREKLDSIQLKNLDLTEEEAIEALSKEFPQNLSRYSYKDLLTEILHLNTVEAQFVKYMDKFEGYMESLHETFGGNPTFSMNYVSGYGEITAPTLSYELFFGVAETKFPLLVELIQSESEGIFAPKKDKYWYKIACQSKPHTALTVTEKKGELPYDAWLETVWPKLDEEERKNLYTQTEFLKV